LDSTGEEDIADSISVLPTLSNGLEIELSDLQAANAMLRGHYLWQVAEIVIGGVPTILEIRFMCTFISPGNILFQGSL
jgi:hypothetical protein